MKELLKRTHPEVVKPYCKDHPVVRRSMKRKSNGTSVIVPPPAKKVKADLEEMLNNNPGKDIRYKLILV